MIVVNSQKMNFYKKLKYMSFTAKLNKLLTNKISMSHFKSLDY